MLVKVALKIWMYDMIREWAIKYKIVMSMLESINALFWLLYTWLDGITL